ncbi:3-oxoacyl-[acyl-carrier-protein] synthase II, chloroplastic isoform X2 [Selaginella moellendorffii]|uniref:3-oxoacyl-[acyl-carrier-protein] synthase II, chloroplastic isoform X2 n=1 Tax=Selaginella moellendorffii TaxID=88036 RepID=UPI000D1C5702|nr:3-oxoacyl-[acyl-carrier-protein] synthase II, chloroplastic isoform X2 [Selaginella moellendorffii]|eukprot:XP_024516335.1 3-oxoacyl-[acyl-carrier-protein] synthase II, chloroplastic isoform X2 [Selaginella moellendorffii]
MAMVGAAAAPLCTWLIAACLTHGICGGDLNSSSISMAPPPAGSRRSRRRARDLQQLHATATAAAAAPPPTSMAGAVVALYESGLSGLGSCLSFEACPEYHRSAKWSPSFFAAAPSSSSSSSSRPSRRRGPRATAAAPGRNMAVAVQPMQPVQPVKESVERKVVATKKRRVVVTGMGVVSCLGHEPDAFYENLLRGTSGITEIENFDCKDFPTRIAGEIKDFSPDGWVAPKFCKRMDKFMLYLLTAGKKAVADAGMTRDVIDQLDKTKCGVLIGSAMGGMQVFSDAIEALRVSYRKMNPFCVPFATTNMGSAMLAMDLGWMGPNYSISTACATSNYCMLSAANHIVRGEADVMLAGGSDAAIIPIGLGGFVACRALSQRNNEPSRASRPWDEGRDGFVMGEGAGVLVLEELEHAKRRGAEIYAEFLGGSSTCDAYHMTEPHPEGAGILLCIEKALAQAGVDRQDVNYVNAHATSTQAGDVQEYKAIMRCFGSNSEIKVNSTKSMTGHLLGAAGGVEAIATIQAIRSGWVHPTINIDTPEKDVNMEVIVGANKQKLDVKVALSNSFGFGGHNSSVIFAPYPAKK